jgi:hypothetical protein
MRKAGKLVGAIVLTFAAGGALIFGNAALAAQTVTAASSPKPLEVIVSEKQEQPTASQAIAERETAVQSEVSTVMKTLGNGATVIVEYYYGENGANATVTQKSVDGKSDISNYEGETAEATIERFGGPKRNLPDRYIEGQAGNSDIAKEVAVSSAIKAITEKYALKQVLLDKFSVTAKFYSTYEEISGAVWWVNLYPANADEFSEIGCYTAILNAETGEAIQLLSAVDGKG